MQNKVHKTITIKAVRSHCVTGIKRTVDVTIKKIHHMGLRRFNSYIIINGGVTEREAIKCTKVNLQIGWLACMGTKNVYDSLFIPAIEMQKVQNLLQ